MDDPRFRDVDKDWSPIPHLAEGHTVTDGGRQYTITLRKGVRFHNGKEMTAADVVASLNRWGRMATPGKALWKSVEAVDAKGPYEIVIHLKEPSGALLSALAVAANGAAIYPKEAAVLWDYRPESCTAAERLARELAARHVSVECRDALDDCALRALALQPNVIRSPGSRRLAERLQFSVNALRLRLVGASRSLRSAMSSI